MVNRIIWADIPVTDMARAKRFYAELLQVEMEDMPGTGGTVSVPSGDREGSVSFDLALMEGFEPGVQGSRIYFDSGGDIKGMAERGVAAGGTLLQAPMDMGPVVGVIAFLLDTEGNDIGIRQLSRQAAE